MKTVVTVAPQQMEVVERAEPTPGPDQALVRVETVGICGSDLHFYLGDHPYVTYPQIQGHEFCGIVVALGEQYHGPIQVGERVAVEPLVPCGTCFPCRRGRPNCCTRLAVLGAHVPGALSELIAVRVESLYPTGDLDAELAALVEPISIGLHAVVRGGVSAGERVVIFGAGPIGQAALLASVDRGAHVLVIDQVPSRLRLAERLGAEVTVDATTENVAQVVAQWTNGDGPAIVFEATGVPSVIRSAVELVASSGRVVIIGLSTQEVSLPVIEFTRKELTILGSRNNAGLFGEAVALVRRNQERVRSLITHRFPFEQAAQALAFALHHPTEAEKVLITIVRSTMNIAIVGAGAMGGLWAAYLSRAGHEVAVVDVAPDLIDTIREQGLRVKYAGETMQARPSATSRPAEVGVADLVFFFVKAQHTASAAELAHPFIAPSTTIASLQNGWGNADVLARSCDPQQLVVGVTYHSATVIAPGQVAHTGTGHTYLGPYGDDAGLERATLVGQLLNAANIETTVTEQVKTEIWKKLILNSTTLPTAALTGLRIGELSQPGPLLELVDAVAAEAVRVAQALGYQIDLAERVERIHAILSGGGMGKASMLQDAEARRKTEIEVINGAVVQAAERLGVEVPLNRALVALIQGLERGWQR